MAIKLISVKCPECGASLDIEEGRQQIFCSYCGTKVMVQNDNEYVYRHIDEAGIKQAETGMMIRLKELELEEERAKREEERAKREEERSKRNDKLRSALIKIWITISVIIVVLGIGIMFLGGDMGPIYGFGFLAFVGGPIIGGGAALIFRVQPEKGAKKALLRSGDIRPLIDLIAVVFVVLLLPLLLRHDSSKDDLSNEASNSEVLTANATFDEITPNVSVAATIELGTEYAFMADAWNVYIAKAVSSNVVKVESWHKTSQSDKKMELSGDIGSFKIDDEANGFSWVDDEHTAFTLIIQDKNNSEVKKPTAVIFTINISDSDADKGTDYSKKIACYEYVNDDWHTYRAIALSDHLIKIECWYRTSSGFWDRHRFGWDVGVIDTENTNTDFEWVDEQHSAFIITMIDPANDSRWEEKKLTSFTLADDDYKYSTVLSFLGKTSEMDEEIPTEPSSQSVIE